MSSSPRLLITALSGVGLATVACADIGVIHALPPWAGTAPALGLGLAAGALLGRPGERSSSAAIVGILLLGAAPLWLPILDGAARIAASAAGLTGAGVIVVAAAGAIAGRLLHRRGAWSAPNAATLAVAALAAPAIHLGVLSRAGAVVTGLAGAVLWAGAAWAGRPEATPEEPSGRLDGLAAGIFLGAFVPGLLAFVGPLVGPTSGLVVRAAAAVAGGLAIATVVARSRARSLRFAGPMVGLGALVLAASVPAVSSWILEALSLGGDRAAIVSAAVVVAALAVPASLVPRGGRGTPLGVGLGLAAWWLLPGTLGPGGPALVGLAAWALALLPEVRAMPSVGARLAAGLLVAAGAAAPLVPLPADGLRAFAVHSLGGDPATAAATIQRYGSASAETLGGARGQAIAFVDEDGTRRVWRDGRSRRLDERVRDPDRFFGYLPALVGPSPQRWLILGDGLGATTDAARRVGVVDVTAFPEGPGARATVGSLTAWNRDLQVDPAVRFVTVDPLGSSPVGYDAILVDLPPLWAFGAGHAVSSARIGRVAKALAPGGVAVFRLPLATMSPHELQMVIGRVIEPFGAVTAWLDPSGAEHLLLVATAEDVRVDAGAAFRAWERPKIRGDLRLGAVDDPATILDRAIADRPALAQLAAAAPRRDAAAAAVLAGRRLERGSTSLPLSALASAAADPEGLFDLSGVPPEGRAELEQRLARAGEVRARYLEMLGHVAAGNPSAAMAAAEMLPEGAGTASDLRVLAEPWLRRGDALLARGRIEAAHAEYLIAFSFSRADVEANRKLGDTYRLQGKLEDAVRHYRTALDGLPTDLDAALGLADAHARANKPRMAGEVLRSVEEYHPGSYVLLVHLAHFETEVASLAPGEAKERLGRARALLQRAAALEPRRPQARAGLARVFYLEEEYDRAQDEIDRAMTLEPSCMYQYWRGLIQYESGAFEGAAGDLTASLLECPDLHDARNVLGAVYAAQNRPEQAKATWEDVLKRSPGNPDAQRNLETLATTKFLPGP